jgi:hypothetical protein
MFSYSQILYGTYYNILIVAKITLTMSTYRQIKNLYYYTYLNSST